MVLRADRQDRSASHPHPPPTRRGSNPRAPRREAEHQTPETGSSCKHLSPIPRIFSKPLITGTFFNTHFMSSLQAYYSATAASPSATHAPATAAWCSSLCTSGIEPPDPTELLNQTSHCFHMHKKYLKVTCLTRKLILYIIQHCHRGELLQVCSVLHEAGTS